ncbi:MAG: ABC transporter ATP-binding protein [Candidatus Sumerlaeota bacterium]
MSEAALDIRALSCTLHGVDILHNVSAEIGAGQTWSIVGANGAGKSTLLKCLMRIHPRSSGQVRLFGQDIARYSQRELARRVSYVPQAGNDQQFPYTIRQFVRMGRYPYSGPFGSSHPGDAAAIDSAMERAGVTEFAERTMRTLSGGERQKVFIAAALAQGGDVLLLDEPTAFLDYRHQAEVYQILHAINRESGATIVTVTHDVNAAILMGGNALALRDGRVAFCGPVGELACEEKLGEIFDATFRFIHDPETGLDLVAPQGATL